MFFAPIIETWGLSRLAEDLGLPQKNVRRWVDLDSIPADWFAAISRAARKRGLPHVTEKHLAAIAEARRLAKTSDSPEPQGAAA